MVLLFISYILFLVVTLENCSGEEFCHELLVSGTHPVPDNHITVSSKQGGVDINAAAISLNATAGWIPDVIDQDQWIQIELNKASVLRGIMTKGENKSGNFVKKYQVLYSEEGQFWKAIEDETGQDKLFEGNKDATSSVTHMFKCPVFAKYVRINPLEWNSSIGLRVDILGCSLGEATTSATTTTTQETTTELSTTGQHSSYKPPVTTRPTSITTVSAKTPHLPSGFQPISLFARAKLSTTAKIIIGIKPKSKDCVKDCTGKSNGDYQACDGCDHYVTCYWGVMSGSRMCPPGLVWDNNKKTCDWRSDTCL